MKRLSLFILLLIVTVVLLTGSLVSAETAQEWFDKGVALVAPLDGTGWEEAAAAFDQAVKIDPNFAKAWAMKGYVASTDQEALDAYNKALAIDPNMAEVWLAKGWLLVDLGRIRDSEDAYNKALAIDPNVENIAFPYENKVITKPTTKVITKPTTKVTTKPTTKATTKPTTKLTIQPTTKFTIKPTVIITERKDPLPLIAQKIPLADKCDNLAADQCYTPLSNDPLNPIPLEKSTCCNCINSARNCPGYHIHKTLPNGEFYTENREGGLGSTGSPYSKACCAMSAMRDFHNEDPNAEKIVETPTVKPIATPTPTVKPIAKASGKLAVGDTYVRSYEECSERKDFSPQQLCLSSGGDDCAYLSTDLSPSVKSECISSYNDWIKIYETLVITRLKESSNSRCEEMDYGTIERRYEIVSRPPDSGRDDYETETQEVKYICVQPDGLLVYYGGNNFAIYPYSSKVNK